MFLAQPLTRLERHFQERTGLRNVKLVSHTQDHFASPLRAQKFPEAASREWRCRGLVGDHSLQTGVLFLQLAQAPRLIHPHPAVLFNLNP